MIKAKTDNGIILGLSDMNMKKLAEGLPIKINLKDLGLPDTPLIIFNGRTEESMAKELMELGTNEKN